MVASGAMAPRARSDARERILGASVSAWLRQEVGAQILREVTELCDGASIPVMPVKGVVTARLLYRDIAERPMADVDVRIRPGDLGRLRRAARAAGWRCTRFARAYGTLNYDFGALSVDVEAHVGPPGLCSLSVAEMLDRCERREIAPGLRVRVPELHDHAVLLAVNAFKDKLVTSASWSVRDLARIVEQPAFRPERFVELAVASRVATLAWVVAWWMHTAQGSGPWGAIAAAIEARTTIRVRYARLVRERLSAAERAPMSLRLLARAGSDSPPMRLQALALAVLCTGELRARDWLSRLPRP
ncbi:MAG TPA: nucleotidyltransferase family protein [Polyangiaceae bacterium]|nr:nucleotidyltransferase family protein [Polyangiaceae bacterium]